MNTLDWKKLEDFIAERNPVEVSAGLINDWYYTAATVWQNGEWKDREAAYVTSYWATPGFQATMANGDVLEVEAYREETPEEAEAANIRHQKVKESLREMAEEVKSQRPVVGGFVA